MRIPILAGAPPTAVVPLRRSWLHRVLDAVVDRLGPRPQPLQEVDYAALAGLNKHTLRDIGAPDWVLEERRRELVWELDRARW